MRPLFHPSVEDVTVEGILHALSDPVRVRIYVDIARSGCPMTCSEFSSISDKTIPKSTLSQHFRALREAGLIHGERCGVEMRNTSRCKEIEKRFPGLVSSIINAHLVQIKENAEAVAKAKRTAKTG